DLEPPTDSLPSGLPAPLIELYARCDGARLYLDSLEIVPSEGVTFEHGRWHFATLEGDNIALDPKGKIWRAEESIEDDVCDGTRLDRWLVGQLGALDLLFDRDGEYAEDVFDEQGEILPIVREQQLRAQIKRDAAAPGPRWRLALVLLDQGA